MSPTAVYGRLAAAFAALVAGVGAVVLAVVLISGLDPIQTATKGGSVAATTTTSTRSDGFPAPPAGAVVFGARAGDDALGLAVTPGQGTVGLQASLVGYPNGISGPISGVNVSFRVTGADGTSAAADATACGPGCYQAEASIAKPTQIEVMLAKHAPPSVAFAMPTAWPPRPAGPILAEAARVWRGLKTLSFTDSLSAGGTITLDTIWRIVAPDRIAYTGKVGGSSVIIGDRRWDRPDTRSAWIPSQQLPVQQPVPFWVSVANAHILGTVSVAGQATWKISFFDPGTPGWFTVLIDKATMHTVDIRMTAIAHFMHDVYGPFNEPIKIVAPA